MRKIDIREVAGHLAGDLTTRRLAIGLGLALGALAAAAIVAWLNLPAEDDREVYEAYEPPQGRKVRWTKKPAAAATLH